MTLNLNQNQNEERRQSNPSKCQHGNNNSQAPLGSNRPLGGAVLTHCERVAMGVSVHDFDGCQPDAISVGATSAASNSLARARRSRDAPTDWKSVGGDGKDGAGPADEGLIAALRRAEERCVRCSCVSQRHSPLLIVIRCLSVAHISACVVQRSSPQCKMMINIKINNPTHNAFSPTAICSGLRNLSSSCIEHAPKQRRARWTLSFFEKW